MKRTPEPEVSGVPGAEANPDGATPRPERAHGADAEAGAAATGPSGWAWWLALGLLLAAFVAVRWRHLDAPLERDEGEYAVFAQLLLDGVPPYAEAVNMKLPGVYVVYAGVLAVFGETARGIHLGGLLAHVLSALLVALIARRCFRSGLAGLAAAGSLLAYLLGPRLQGPWANAETFLLPFALLAGLLLVHALGAERRLRWLVATGLALGCAVLVKQHGAFFCLAAGGTLVAWHLRAQRRAPGPLTRDALVLIGATLTPYLATVALLALAGAFDRFWFWTWEYARSYTGQFGLGDLWTNLAQRAPGTLQATWPLVVAAAAGIVAAVARPRLRAAGAAVAGLALLSFCAVSVGYLYRPHYFQLLAPAVALGCGALVAAGGTRRLAGASAALVGLAVLYVPWEERVRLFELSPSELTAATYTGNGFEAMPEVGEYLAELVPEGERFAVIGSEPELYFYADRRPATAYLYTYALMEEQPYALRMSGEMAREIEDAAPDVLVVMISPLSWLRREGSETYIMDWVKEYVNRGLGFERVGVLLRARGGLRLFREEHVENVRAPREAVVLEIYRRKQA